MNQARFFAKFKQLFHKRVRASRQVAPVLEILEPRWNPTVPPWFPGAGQFQNTGRLASLTTPGELFSIDWNRDGRDDLIAAQGFANSVTLLINQGHGAFASTTISVAGNPQSVVAGDWDGDGFNDLAIASYKTDQIQILLAKSSTEFQEPFALPLPPGSGPKSLVQADFNRDGRADLAALQTDIPAVTVFLGQASGQFGDPVHLNLSFGPAAFASGDLNADGTADLVVTPLSGSTAALIFGDGRGGFQTEPWELGGTGAGKVSITDFDQDGRNDLAISIPGSEGVRVWSQEPGGGFVASRLVPFGGTVGPLQTRDLSGDAIPDLLVGVPGLSQVGLALGRGDGGFAAPLTFPVGSPPQSLAVGDFVEDSLLDLAFAAVGSNEIQGLQNTTFPRSATFTVGQTGQSAFQAAGNPAPQYTLVEGVLPDGLTLDSKTGTILGTPQPGAGGKWTMVLEADNGSPQTARLSLELTIQEAPAIPAQEPPTFFVGESGSFALVATGYPDPQFSILSGRLPVGVTLNPVTGTIEGEPGPASPGLYPLQVMASNGIGSPAIISLDFQVVEAPRFTSSDSFSIDYGKKTTVLLEATGFPQPTFTVDFLPEGLTLDPATGLIEGFARSVGTFFFTVTASNGTGREAQQSISLSVNPGQLVIAAEAKSKVYGAPLPSLSATFRGLAPWDGPEAVRGLKLITLASTKSAVGEYAIEPVGAESDLYTIEYESSVLTVTKAPLTVTADPKSRFYGGNNPAFTAQISGLVNGDTGRVVTGLKFSTPANRSSRVGQYDITPLGARANNYAIQYQPGTLTIHKAPLTIVADPKTKIYGAPNPVFTAKWVGLVNGNKPVDFSGLTFDTIATISSGVGRYSITPRGVTADNYAIAYADGALSIVPAPLIVVPNDQIMERGTALPSLTARLQGLILGDGPSVVTGLNLTTTARPDSPVGNYPITGSGGVSGNYRLTYKQGTLRVLEAPKFQSANTGDFTYGKAGIFTFQASGTPAPVFSLASSLPAGVTFQASKGLLSTTGSVRPGVYTIRVSASNGQTTPATQEFTLRVAKAPLTITPEPLSREYGAANPRLTARFQGFLPGDGPATVDGLTLRVDADAKSPIGVYPIVASGAKSALYEIRYATGELTITPRSLAWTPPVTRKTYGTGLNLNPQVNQAANQTASAYHATAVDVSGFFTRFVFQTQALTPIPGDGFTFVIQANGPTALGTLGDGLGYQGIGKSVAIKFDLFNNGGEGDNSTGIYLNGARPTTPALSLASTPIQLRSDSPFAAEIGYDGKTMQVKITDLVTGQSATQDYPVNLSQILGTNLAWVGFTASTGALTARQSILGWEFRDRNRATVFGFSDFQNTTRLSLNGAAIATGPALVLTGFGTAGTINPGDGAGPFGITLHSPGISTLASAGQYPLTAVLTGPGAQNYRLDMKGAQLVVDPAPLLVKATDAFKVYGTIGVLDTKGYKIEGTLVGSDTITSVQLNSTAVDIRARAGNHPIVPSSARGKGVENYQITYSPGNFAVARASLTITPEFKTKRYGAPLPTLTAAYTGLVAGDKPDAIRGLRLETLATAASGVGDYPIIASGAVSDNYTIRYGGNGLLTVTRAPLTIRADNKTKTYGEPVPPLTATITGLVNGDDPSLVRGLRLLADVRPNSPVGSYRINPNSAIASNNYAIEYIEGELRVEKAQLTLTIDNKTKVYGAALPVFTASFSGLVAGDTAQLFPDLGLTTTAQPVSPIGVYPIFTNRVFTATNYEVVVKPGQLQVTKAPLTIRPLDQEKVYGQTLVIPERAFTATGLVPGDRIDTLRLSSNGAEARAGAGTFNILASQESGVGLGNYDIRYQPGTLTVKKAPLTVRALDAQKVYGAPLPKFAATFRGFVNGDTEAMVEDLRLTTAATASSGVGTYRILLGSGSSRFYELNFEPGTLTITPAPLVIQVNDALKKRGEANPKFSATFQGLIQGDKASAITGLIFETEANATSPTGRYAIRASGAKSPNYTISYREGTLTVGQVPSFTGATQISLNAGQAQTYGLATSGFPEPKFTLTRGTLPSGVTFDGNLGILNFSPGTQKGTHRFTIQASNGVGVASAEFTLNLV